MSEAIRKFLAGEAEARAEERCLGNKLLNRYASERRMNFFATLTGGKGFRVPKKPLRTNAQGQTRGDRKRALYRETFNTAY